MLEDGLMVTEVADKIGVSRQNLHAWLRRYAQGRLDALADRSHRPRSCPHQMPPQVEVRLVELRQAHPSWGPDRLLYRLERENVDALPSRAAVGRALSRLGLANAASRRERKRKYRSWERARPMELWQFDVMGGIILTDGTQLNAVTGNGKVFTGRTPAGRSRCCLTGSAARTASSTCSLRLAPQPRPARSNGSTAPCAPNASPTRVPHPGGSTEGHRRLGDRVQHWACWSRVGGCDAPWMR